MTLGAAYATKAELKGYAEHMSDTTDDTQLDETLLQASRAIEHYCGRQFNAAGAATARVYYPDSHCKTIVDDISTTVGLVIKTDGGDGTYGTTWSASQYQLEPLNNVVEGETGWPYYVIRAVGTLTFPCAGRTAPLQVTANWGWAAVPTAIKIACIYLALETFKLKGAPFGVANFDQFGPMRVRDNPKVMAMLQPYRLTPVLVG
jgi:hypothetical protein